MRFDRISLPSLVDLKCPCDAYRVYVLVLARPNTQVRAEEGTFMSFFVGNVVYTSFLCSRRASSSARSATVHENNNY